MILMKNDFRVALVTTHIPVREIATTITKELIQEKLMIFHRCLKQDFGIGAPRIAVLSLNPHAGDGGLLGMEEQEVIIPAMKEMEEKGILCYGPYAADGFMGSGNYTHFDGILAMYHDQGLAPFKALAMEDGVNYTILQARDWLVKILSVRQSMLPSMCSVIVSGKKWLVPIRCVNSITRNVTIVIN